jgi:hypothetical protein
MMREPTLDDVVYIEAVALMIEGVLEPPCRYATHIPWVWWNEGGRALCGVCHPPVGEETAA